MSSPAASFLALSCIGAFATAPAYAVEDPTTGKAVAVNANDDPQAHNDVIVNGVRQQRDEDPKQVAPLINTPRSVIVLDRSVIEQTGSNTLQDALRTVPGITFGAAEGGNPIGDRPFIRGFDSQGSIYVDGVRDFSSQSREVFAVESIQIVRGSNSTLGGRGSPGGTINIISKQPQLGDFGSLSGSFGNASYKRVVGDLNLQVLPGAAFRIEGMWHDQDVAGRDAIYQRRWGVAPSFTIGLGTPTRLTAGYYHLTTNELPDSGLPYLYTIGNAPGTGAIVSRPALGTVTLANGQTGYVDRSTFYGLTARDFRHTTVDQATLRAEHDFGGVTLRNTARYTHTYQGYIYTQPDDSQGDVYGNTAIDTGANLTSGGYVWRRANTRYGYADSLGDQLDLYGTFSTGSIKHSFAAGAEVDIEKARRGTYVVRGFLNPTTGVETISNGGTISPRCSATTVSRYYCTSLFDPNPDDPYVSYASDTSTTPSPIVKTTLAEETQQDGWTQAAYAFNSVTLTPSLILNLGARYDHFTSRLRPGLPYGGGTAFDLTRSDGLFNWQAGAVYKPAHHTSLYASYATAATPPNALLGEGQDGNALGTTNTAANLALIDSLKVTRTKSYEVGAKAQLFHEKLALTIAGFQTDTDNARVTQADGTVGFIGKTRIRGAELTYNGQITPWWSVFGGYTFLDPVIVDGGFTVLTAAAVTGQAAKTVQVVSVNTSRQTPQTPRHSLTAYTSVTPVKRFTIGGGGIFTSRVYGGYSDNRAATQTSTGVVTVNPATKLVIREVPGYVRFDANASYQLTRHIQLSVNAQNLTDKAYFTQAYTTHYASIAPGRTVFGTVKVGF